MKNKRENQKVELSMLWPNNYDVEHDAFDLFDAFTGLDGQIYIRIHEQGAGDIEHSGQSAWDWVIKDSSSAVKHWLADELAKYGAKKAEKINKQNGFK